ncbi:MAG: hypothetical protein JO041_04405, partial [Acidobacteria bacterium]|nr:hypothetical protein [Acidobacteriota bacterium]
MALLTVLIIVVMLSILAGAVLSMTATEFTSTTDHRALLEARYAAEAGAQRTANWIMYSYTAPANGSGFDLTRSPVQAGGSPVVLSADSTTANYPTASVQTAFNSALQNQSLPGFSNVTFSSHATLMNMQAVTFFQSGGGVMQTWLITATGSVSGVHPAKVQVQETIERFATPIFNYALAATASGCGVITFSSSSYTDSFNSSSGTYAQTVQSSGGNVQTNGNANMSGSAQFKGTLSTTNSGSGNCNNNSPNAVTNNSSVNPPYSSLIHLTSAVRYPNPAAPSPTPPTT